MNSGDWFHGKHGGGRGFIAHYEGALPLMSIAQCIELLNNKTNEMAMGYNNSGCFWRVVIGPNGTGAMIEGFGKEFADYDSGELIDALWQAVKEVL